MSGESLGNTKYSGRNPDRASWDEADHLACFVWHVKHENTRSNNGIFYNRNLSDTTIEKIIWSLKDWIRQKHAPSYINTAMGGTALFGTTREEGEKSVETRGTKRKREAKENSSEKQVVQTSGEGLNTSDEDTDMGKEDSRDEDLSDKDLESMIDEESDKDTEEIIADRVYQNWGEEILKPKQRLYISRITDTFDIKDPYWQYLLVVQALDRTKRIPEDNAVIDIDEHEQAEAIINDDDNTWEPVQTDQRSTKKKKYTAGDELKTDVFESVKYQDAEEYDADRIAEAMSSDIMQPTQIGLTVFEAQRDWFNNRDFQREDHDMACSMLGIENTKVCRIRGMRRSACLKFWQPVIVWALFEMRFKAYLKGCILADSVGLGKTWEALAFILKIVTDFNEECERARRKKAPYPDGKPNIIVLPPGLIQQWAREITSMTSVFDLYIYYGDYKTQSNVSSKIIEERLTRDHELFNKKPETARALILTSYQTLNSRHGPGAVKTESEKRERRFNPTSPKMPNNWKYSLAGKFNIGLFDEAQELRNPTSFQNLACQWLACSWNVLLTGTPWYNSVQDFRGYMPLVFKEPRAWDETLLYHHNMKAEDIFTIEKGHQLEYMLCTDEAIETHILSSHLSNYRIVGERMRRVLALLMVRRTIMSTIPFQCGKMIGSDIPGSQKKIVTVKYDEYELSTYKSAEKESRRGLFVRDHQDRKRFFWNSKKLRKLVLIASWLGFIFLSSSLEVSKIPAALRLLERGILVDTWITQVEKKAVVGKDMTVKDFYRTAKANKHATNTARLEFLLRGSPKMRAMLPIIRDQVLLYKEKAIVWTLYPAEQVYVAAVLNEVGLDYGVYHSGLNFNHSASECMVLINSFSVNSAGLNLQNQCRNVHLFSPTISKSIRNQAIGRSCRLGQSRIVLVYEYIVNDSFNTYLQDRGDRKAMAGLIIEMTSLIRSNSDEIEDNGMCKTDLTRWVIRGTELVYLENGVEAEDSDVQDPELVFQRVLKAMEGEQETEDVG
ncbi:SNF2 family N-terminal domain-containing protein [Aspergillus tamarii]|uniref:SNF2 family N-terminal domain-containing protein n=1 Tax=Aspergillus tamarii TaxID=41984 RepID=A0A5N6V3P9_ASPTM|nr:SNF2 family N-terminal domain-containing protein [Aspergillus tamarii]